MDLGNSVEIEIADFKEDPANGCAFAILFDVKGPGERYEMVTIYFTETFMEQYFHIPWYKNLPREENRLLHDQRELFIRWALIKVEQHLKEQIPQEKIIIDYETDAAWAEKVEKGVIQPQSRPGEKHIFLYSR